MIEHWARWTFASIAYAVKSVDFEPTLVDGLDDRTDAFEEKPHRAEIRINGPWIQQQQGDYRVWADVNVLVTSFMGGDAISRHELSRIAGLYQKRLTEPIQVWNYGDQDGDWTEDDPESQILLGCLVNRSGRNDMTKLFHFGQIDKTNRVRQAIVDARYEMFLENT
jgi:hypothetical protein